MQKAAKVPFATHFPLLRYILPTKVALYLPHEMPQSTEGYFRHRKIEGKHMFNKRVKVKDLLTTQPENQDVTVMGWVRTMRNNQFIALNDGSTNNNLQVVAELGRYDDELLKRITTGAALKVTGEMIPSPGKGQKVELKAATIEVL